MHSEKRAYILKKNTGLDAWPVGTLCATGKSKENLNDAFIYAAEAFVEFHGRLPHMEKCLFRGAFTKFYTIFEIGEMQD